LFDLIDTIRYSRFGFDLRIDLRSGDESRRCFRDDAQERGSGAHA